VDVAADYGFTLANLLRSESELGRISLKAMMTIYDKAEQVPLPGQATVDLLGAAGGSTEDQGYVKRVGMANVGYALQGLSFNWNLRYIGRTAMAPASFLQEGFPKIGSHTYHNIRLGYTWRTQDFFVGINNVFDKQPPFFASGSAGTQALDTVPAYYDIFGRSFYGGFRARF
jgi:iron complex outermembrane recepter protein